MGDWLQPVKNFFITLKFITKGNKWYYGWIAFLAFLTLLITDILGYTDVFPFVKKSAE